jgi:hypothetical protein
MVSFLLAFPPKSYMQFCFLLYVLHALPISYSLTWTFCYTWWRVHVTVLLIMQFLQPLSLHVSSQRKSSIIRQMVLQWSWTIFEYSADLYTYIYMSQGLCTEFPDRGMFNLPCGHGCSCHALDTAAFPCLYLWPTFDMTILL